MAWVLAATDSSQLERWLFSRRLKVSRTALGEDTAAARRAIVGQDMKHTVEVLASDEFEGREGGSAGNKKAGEWLVGEIAKLATVAGGKRGQAHAPKIEIVQLFKK